MTVSPYLGAPIDRTAPRLARLRAEFARAQSDRSRFIAEALGATVSGPGAVA